MGNKNLILFFCAIISIPVLYAQRCDTIGFQSIYWNKNSFQSDAYKIIPSGPNVFFLGYASEDSVANSGRGVWLMKMNSKGTPLWSKVIGSIDNETFADGKQTKDGGFIICGSTAKFAQARMGWISKVDSSGNVQWSVELGREYSHVSSVVQLEDGGYAAVGLLLISYNLDNLGNPIGQSVSRAIIIRLDKDGNTIWWKSFYLSVTAGFNGIAQLQDKGLLVSGGASAGIPGTGIAFLAKFDYASGIMIWGNSYTKTGPIIEQPDRSLRMYTDNSVSYLDPDGKFIKGIFIHYKDVTAYPRLDLGFIGSRGDIDYYIYRESFYSKLLAVKRDSGVIWARQYPDREVSTTKGAIGKNNFYIGGEFSNLRAYLIQTDAVGKTPCSDTLDVPFIINPVNDRSDDLPALIDDGVLDPKIRTWYSSKSMLPVRNLVCYDVNCCFDTMIYKNAVICQGSDYVLPDGSSINTGGIYSSLFTNSTGCDSMVFTTVKTKQPVSVSLGSDTCLENNKPIVYSFWFPDKVDYLWQDGSRDSFFVASQPGRYWVRVASTCNIATDTVTIVKDCDLPVFIPSAFTPNGDGLNDIFNIADMKGQHLVDFSVYNRFGNKIFHTSSTTKGWDGLLQPVGAYVYIISYRNKGGRLRRQSGTVILIR
jgi:gliding motility-associated-like protein